MAVRDTHYLELVQRERLAEAAMEREASVAARDGWTPDPGPVKEPEPGLARDIGAAALRALARGLGSVGLIMEGGWMRWLGGACLGMATAAAMVSARRIGRRIIERREARSGSCPAEADR